MIHPGSRDARAFSVAFHILYTGSRVYAMRQSVRPQFSTVHGSFLAGERTICRSRISLQALTHYIFSSRNWNEIQAFRIYNYVFSDPCEL